MRNLLLIILVIAVVADPAIPTTWEGIIAVLCASIIALSYLLPFTWACISYLWKMKQLGGPAPQEPKP